jgi:DNA-binding transcriptional LysR family regulator
MWTDDLTRLRSLIAVIDTGSVVAAAEATGYSTAAVSRHVSALERELGVTLFERTARSLRASVLARVMADKARLLLDEAHSFSDEVRSLVRGNTGVIRLAYFRAVGTTVLPLIIAEMQARHPDVQVITTECSVSEEVVALLRSGEADLGFVWGFPAHTASDLLVTPVLRDALVLLTSAERDDLHEDPSDLTRLAHEPFVSTTSHHTGSFPLVERMFFSQGLPAPTVRYRYSDHAMTKALIATGVAVALLPSLGVSDAAPGTRRSIVVPGFRRIFVARGPHHPAPLVSALESAIRKAVREYRGYGVECEAPSA